MQAGGGFAMKKPIVLKGPIKMKTSIDFGAMAEQSAVKEKERKEVLRIEEEKQVEEERIKKIQEDEETDKRMAVEHFQTGVIADEDVDGYTHTPHTPHTTYPNIYADILSYTPTHLHANT
jgi:hypothetical protein